MKHAVPKLCKQQKMSLKTGQSEKLSVCQSFHLIWSAGTVFVNLERWVLENEHVVIEAIIYRISTIIIELLYTH